jgi:sugar phosphate permease
MAYALFHASRRAPSIAKSVLTGSTKSDGWAPFDGVGGTGLLGCVDLSFLLAYAAGMFVCGHVADRFSLRRFLSLGMVLSGAAVAVFGMGYLWDVHDVRCALNVCEDAHSPRTDKLKHAPLLSASGGSHVLQKMCGAHWLHV